MDSWFTAQIKARPCEVAEFLSSSEDFHTEFTDLQGQSIAVIGEGENLVVAYCVAGSDWTCLEFVRCRYMCDDAIMLATEEMNSSALIFGFEDSVSAFYFNFYRDGEPIEQYASADVEYHEFSVEESLELGWRIDKSGCCRHKTSRDVDVDLENMDGFAILSDLTDELGLHVPRNQWQYSQDPPRIEQFANEGDRAQIDSAYLLHMD